MKAFNRKTVHHGYHVSQCDTVYRARLACRLSKKKEQHLSRMRESGHFRFTREVLLHHIEQGDAARFLEMGRSNAFSHQFQFTEQEMGLDRIRSAAFQYIGSEPIPWYVSYRVRIGVK